MRCLFLISFIVGVFTTVQAKAIGKRGKRSTKNRIFLVKHAGRAAKSRTAFYHLELGKGLLLDQLMPDWKTSYFEVNVWLNDLLEAALRDPN